MKNLTKNLTLKNTLANSSSGRKVLSDSVTNIANVDLVDTVTTKEDVTYKKKRQDSISDLS